MLDQSRSFASYARGVLRLTQGQHYDLVYASSSRLMMSVLGDWVSRRKGIPLYLDIRDLFVDTIKEVLPGRITTFAMPVLSQLEKRAVRRASRVDVVSGGFVPYFKKHFPGVQSWTPLIGQPLQKDKCFPQDERDALERSDETQETDPLTGIQGQGRTGGLPG